MIWKKCNEELPKERGAYLINWDGTVIEAEYYPDIRIWGDGEVSVYIDVTHWMPLPPPPGESDPALKKLLLDFMTDLEDTASLRFGVDEEYIDIYLKNLNSSNS
jgi:hypothetical protein